MKIVVQAFVLFVLFIFLINLSFKVFNTVEPWTGIGMGFVSVVAFLWGAYRLWKKTGPDGKEKQ